MKTYDQAPKEVHDRVKALIERFYPDLKNVGLRVDLLMASTDSEDGHAVTCGGYPAYAVVRIVNLKDRAKECGDAEITIDRDEYEAMTTEKRDALLDHELYHIEVKRDREGRPKRDDHQRPVLKLRKHDFQVGWFHEIARRHGANSVEVQQATSLVEEQGQTYFNFETEADNTRSPQHRELDRRLQEIVKPAGTTVTVMTPGTGAGFTVDASGIHKIDAADDGTPFDEATVKTATDLVRGSGKATVASLQRFLHLGFNRATALMAELERRLVVGPENPSGRQIFKTAHAA